MRLDTLSSTPGVRQSPGRSGDDRLTEPHRPWWTLGCMVVAVLAVGAAAVALVAGDMWSRETGPTLTHRITRGNLLVAAIEQGLLESAENWEIRCKARGHNTVIWVIENGTVVKSGEELVRLETRQLQEQIDERTKYALWSRSAAERSAADLARAQLAITEYEQGRYVAELMKLESDFVVAEANLQSAGDMLSHARMMAGIGYMSELDVEECDFALAQAKLDLEVKKTDIDVLKRFTQAEQLQTLKGALAAAKATHDADVERAVADASRLDRALAEIQHCQVKADRSGLVIHPSAAQWEAAPIAAGATVHMDQILLLMPDLSGSYCFVKSADGIGRRALELGDTNGVFTIVKEGLDEGDEVILNPLAVREAPRTAAKTPDGAATTAADPGSH